MYFFIMYMFLSLSNVFIIWVLMELVFLFFLLFVITNEMKSTGLIIYFFFQSVASLFLFMAFFLVLDNVVFFLLVAKLGMFPFFYWMVVVSVKVGYLANVFVLSLQKISIMWLFWLVLKVDYSFLVFMVYLSVFFSIFSLLMIADLWLLVIYSSIANSGMLLLAVNGGMYMFSVVMYLVVVAGIIFFIKWFSSYNELMLVVFFFLVIPPFLLFFMKFYVIISLDFYMKIGFLVVVFDVLVLLYYFSLIFVKFILMDLGVLIYMMNLLVIFFVLMFSNCVAMIIFY